MSRFCWHFPKATTLSLRSQNIKFFLRAPLDFQKMKAIAALPAILAYDRREVRQRFEERFTVTRMAQDNVSTYRQSMKTRTASTRPRQLALNGGNGLAPISIEKPFVALFEAGADPEIPT
jgi:hypothetical protein